MFGHNPSTRRSQVNKSRPAKYAVSGGGGKSGAVKSSGYSVFAKKGRVPMKTYSSGQSR